MCEGSMESQMGYGKEAICNTITQYILVRTGKAKRYLCAQAHFIVLSVIRDA